MFQADFEQLSPKNLKWLSKFTDEVLGKWGFGLSQRLKIKSHISETLPEKMSISFLLSYQYKHSGILIENASLRSTQSQSYSTVNNSNNFNPVSVDPLQEAIYGVQEEEQPIVEETVFFSEILVESPHDIQVKYLNTYGLRDGTPIEITGVEHHSGPSSHVIYYTTINPDFSFTSKKSYNIGEFNMTLPKIGMINTDKVVILIERKHKRGSPYRYRKALVPEVLDILNISEISIKELGILDPYSSYAYGNSAVIRKLLYDIYNPKRFTYEEALNLVKSGMKISCAFSQSLAIGACFRSNKVYLYKNQWILGTFNSKKNSFLLNNDYFLSELDRYGVIYEYE